MYLKYYKQTNCYDYIIWQSPTLLFAISLKRKYAITIDEELPMKIKY